MMPPRVPVPDTLPEPVELRLLPYWAAVRQYRQTADPLKAQYFWLYIESCEASVNGVVVADMVEALPFHILFKMQRNLGVAA